MLLLYLQHGLVLLVKGQIVEPLDDRTHCKLSTHFQNLSMLENRRGRRALSSGSLACIGSLNHSKSFDFSQSRGQCWVRYIVR